MTLRRKDNPLTLATAAAETVRPTIPLPPSPSSSAAQTSPNWSARGPLLQG